MSSPKSVVVLTGAGISKESGLKTFRDEGGLWEGHRVEEVATPEAFALNPELVYDFYNQRRRQLQSGEVHPNEAHQSLAEFEQNFAGEFLLVTQNVDNLHERAGSKNILHMHGQLLEARSQRTDEVFDWREDMGLDTPHPKDPKRLGDLRPNIVWFGEMPHHMGQIEAALETCDLFVAVGTSGVVYPAAGFVQWTQPTCRRVLLNLEDTPVGGQFTESYLGPASQVVPEFFRSLLG